MSHASHVEVSQQGLDSRFVAQLPEHGPKEQRNADGEGESGGVVGGSAPEGDKELPDDDQVLLPEVAGVLGVEVQGGQVWVWGADLLDHPLLSPAQHSNMLLPYS